MRRVREVALAVWIASAILSGLVLLVWWFVADRAWLPAAAVAFLIVIVVLAYLEDLLPTRRPW